MNRIAFLMFVFAISSPDTNNAKVYENKNILSYGNWEEVRNAGEIKTFVRWLYFSDGSKTRERKGVIRVNCSLKKALEIITNASVMREWMSGVVDNYRLSGTDSGRWFTYTLFDIPWPFEQRDLVSCYHYSQPSSNHAVISISSSADFIPRKPCIERLADYKAEWIITTETSLKNTLIVFKAASSAPQLVPRCIQDPVIEKMFYSNLVRLKQLLYEESSE